MINLPDKPILIRADAGPQIGTGHVMRSLALAQAWQDATGQAVFAVGMEAGKTEARLKSEGLEVIYLSAQPGSADDAIQTANLARRKNAAWAVVDGCNFGGEYQRIIKDSGMRLLVIDDKGHADHYYADIVLNQNIHAHEGLYSSREPYTRLLLGASYVLVRGEFLKWREWKRTIPERARRVLVTLGGSDPDNGALKVIQALKLLNKIKIELTVVIGPMCSHLETIYKELSLLSFPFTLSRSAEDMADLMAWADIAVIAAGGTLWELLYMGCPTISFVRNAIQDIIVKQLEKMAVVKHQGYLNQIDPITLTQSLQEVAFSRGERKRMSTSGRVIVDGKGTSRVMKTILGC